MTLQDFAFRDVATSVALNALIADLPRTYVAAFGLPMDVNNTGQTSSSATLTNKDQAMIAPVVADYLVVYYSLQSVTQQGELEIWAETELGAVQLHTDTVAAGSFKRVRTLIDLSDAPIVGDLRGTDIELEFWLRVASTPATARISDIVVQCGMGSALTDYLEP